MPRHQFGSITPGLAGWQKRWDETPIERRVMMIAPRDFAGSMYKWAAALNQCSNYAVRLVTFSEHAFGYSNDLVVPECDKERFSGVMALYDQAGILHLKDEISWFSRTEAFTNIELIDRLFFDAASLKPRVFTHYGSNARILKSDARYVNAVRSFDQRIAMTPDLNYTWFDGCYIPHTIDTDSTKHCWTDSCLLAHSPSKPELKGTDLVEASLKALEREPAWKGWRVDIISGVPFSECMERKQRASLFFDQAGQYSQATYGITGVVGWYGNSAVEAMALGIPTIAHLSDDAFLGAQRASVDMSMCPIINIEPTVDGMTRALARFAASSASERFELSKATRQFAADFHSYPAVAARLSGSYRYFR